ncbi:MAG TPA: hypothetical protein DHV29_08715 [Bacteroidales bacterium]|nr:MAG: hypothetical protein A2W94_00355 [Bacteroidetes bacterium GWE2_42_42]HBG70286.1 hypothetical protein [Bacteroidales bacterium]HCB60329.1 hypothetical protein [Bacteroidales bacterium]HCY23559.1 hypothetical protein [Bacteroidales bacterium]
MVQLNKNIYNQLTSSFSFLKDLPSRFRDAGLEAQQRIIGSIFPGKLFFSENKVRTSKVNEVVTLFASIGAPFGRNKKGRFCEKAETSFEVNLSVLNSNTFLEDLKKISDLSLME